MVTVYSGGPLSYGLDVQLWWHIILLRAWGSDDKEARLSY